jgi:hypothetical protein
MIVLMRSSGLIGDGAEGIDLIIVERSLEESLNRFPDCLDVVEDVPVGQDCDERDDGEEILGKK